MITVSTFIDVQNNYLRDALIVLTVYWDAWRNFATNENFINYFFMAVFSVSSWCLLLGL